MAPVRNNELTPVNIHTSEFTPKIEGKSYSQTKYFDNGIADYSKGTPIRTGHSPQGIASLGIPWPLLRWRVPNTTFLQLP